MLQHWNTYSNKSLPDVNLTVKWENICNRIARMETLDIAYRTILNVFIICTICFCQRSFSFIISIVVLLCSCFLHGRNLLIFGFLLEMLGMFLFNVTVFMLITYRLTCRRTLIIHQQTLFTEMYLRVKRIYGFWLLLGISWIFGFLSAIDGPINVVFQMIFGLCMTLQGVGIFIVLVLNNPEIKKKVAKITYSRKSEMPSTVQSTWCIC